MAQPSAAAPAVTAPRTTTMVVASGALRPATPTRPVEAEPVPPREPPHPSTTTVDGSLHEPVAAADAPAETPRAWAPPPWLSESNASNPGATAPAAAPIATAAATPPAASTTHTVDAAPVPTPAPTLDDVALRMKRIKASAAAIREAIEVEAQRVSVGDEPGPEPTAAFAAAPAPAPMIPAPQTVLDPRAAANDILGDGFDDDLDGDLDAILPGRAPVDPNTFDERPATRRDAAAPTDLERSFLGGDDDFEDGDDFAEGDGGIASFAPAARPIPWRPILIGAGVMVAIGAWVFRAQLFPSSEPAAETNVAAEVRPGSVAPDETKAAPSKAPAPAPVAAAPADPAAGKPVTADPATPVSAPGATPAATPGAMPTAATGPAPAAPAGGTPPASRPAPDADTSARLDEARSLYVAAKGGTQRKKLGEAKTLLQEILATAPMQADALLLLSQIELELGHADAALTTAMQCTQAAAEIADCWLTIGVLQQDRRKKAEATLAYEKYLALAPDGRYAGDVRSQLKRLKK